MDETTLDLRDIIKILKKRRRIIINIFLACVFLAALVSFIIPPTYEGEATLRIKQPKGLADSLLADLPMGNVAATKQLMSTYAEIIKSRTVVQELIDKTQSNKEKIPTYEAMLNRITTQSVKDTEILNVKVQAPTPEEAQYVTNTLVEIFLNRMTNLVRSEQSTVRKFIGDRLRESKKELEQAEEALKRYKRDHQIISPEDETKAMVAGMAELAKMQAENAVALASAQASEKGFEYQLGQEKPGFIADSPLIQQYKGKLAELEVQLVSLKQNYTDKHPQVMAVKAAIAETQKKLEAEVTKVIRSEAPSMNMVHLELLKGKILAGIQVSSAMAQQAAIRQITAESEKKLDQLPVKEQGLAKVMRDVMVAQEIYVMLAKRHEEARISEVMQPTDVQVIDNAVVPEKPIKPRKALNIAIAAILGLFFGTATAFGLEYMNRTIRTAEDVQRYLELPVLGSIPVFEEDTASAPAGFWGRIAQKFSHKKKRERA